jgi:hypothetical protein
VSSRFFQSNNDVLLFVHDVYPCTCSKGNERVRNKDKVDMIDAGELLHAGNKKRPEFFLTGV